MPRKQRKSRKIDAISSKEIQRATGSQERTTVDQETVRATLEEQLAAAHNSSIDFHANLKNAIALMQQVAIRYTPQNDLTEELSSVRIVLNRMTQMSLYLDVYSDYVQFLFCEGLIDADHCDLAINGIQQTMDRAIVLINAANLVVQKVHLKQQDNDYEREMGEIG